MFNRYMQYRRELAKVVLIWFGVAAVVGALSLAAGLWLGREVLNPTTDLEAEVQELRAQLDPGRAGVSDPGREPVGNQSGGERPCR